jgi:hypothetical protein
MAVLPQSVGKVLWTAKPSAGTARPHLLKISAARKSVVAVAGDVRRTQRPLCPHSDQLSLRSEMMRWANGDPPPEMDLFNHLVSERHQACRDFETKRFRRPRVDT